MPACALASGPLVLVRPAYSYDTLCVQACLDAPLFNHVEPRELVLLAAAVDAAAERAEKVKGAVFTQAARLQKLDSLCRTLKPGLKPVETLHDLGILDYFPYLARRLTGQQQQQQYASPVTQHLGVSYLQYISLLNQVVMMSTQLYNDATNPAHHKYAAHQVALLYQSLNMLQGETKPIRRVIEGRFDEIKVVTESSRPMLAASLSHWLQQITWVCREEVAVCPGYTHKRLAPVAKLLKGSRR